MTYSAQLGLYIDGEWLGSGGRNTHSVLNPATGQGQADLPLASSADLDRALDAAGKGFKTWRTVEPAERAAVLNRTAKLIRERADTIARLVTLAR